MKVHAFAILFSTLLLSCKNAAQENSIEKSSSGSEQMIPVEPNGGNGSGALSLKDAFLQTIASAHKKDAFSSHEAVSFNINLTFDGKNRLDGTLTLLTDGSKVRIDKKDGSSIIFEGNNVFVSPKDASVENARFDILTWAYFFTFPYKLQDPGTSVVQIGNHTLEKKSLEAFKLTFDANTGDSPDDWYIGYLDEDQKIYAAGYIVTFGKSLEQAEENPHAIVYSNYENLDQIPIARNWEFYNWSLENGLQGNAIGKATLTNIHFNTPEARFFETPTSYKIVD